MPIRLLESWWQWWQRWQALGDGGNWWQVALPPTQNVLGGTFLRARNGEASPDLYTGWKHVATF
jgi:hypothetical protein